jgi:hypothetical protein
LVPNGAVLTSQAWRGNHSRAAARPVHIAVLMTECITTVPGYGP